MYAQGVIRVLVLAWACTLITWSVHYVLVHTPKIGSDAAAALTAIIGILTVAVSLYEWHRPGGRDAGEPH